MRNVRRREPTPTSGRSRRRRLAGVVVFGALLLAAVGGAFVVRGLWREDPEPWLAEAREELTALLSGRESPEGRVERARRAEELLRRYREADGAEPDAAGLLLASALFVRGEPGEAQTLLDGFDPARTATADLERAATVAFRTGQFGLADRLIGEALSRNDHREATLRTAIEIRYDLGRDEDVLAHIEELRALAPDDPRPSLAAALVYRDRGDWDHVVDACREYLRLRPEGDESEEVRLRLIEALITLGSADEARAESDRLASGRTGFAAAYPLLEARLLHLEGRSDEALSLAGRILDADPRDVGARLLRGRILLAKADYAGAVAALEEVTKADPANFEAHYLLGQAYGRTGQTDRAREELRIHQRLLDARVAIHRLERRAGRDPADAEVRRDLARRYREIGVPDLAAFWDQAADAAQASSE